MSLQGLCELLLIVAVVAPVLWHGRNAIRRIPATAQVVLGALLLAVVVGHLACRPYSTFPFVPWWMYGEPARSDTITVIRVIGYTEDKREIELNPSQLHPPLGMGSFRIANRLRDLSLTDKAAAVAVAESLANGRFQHVEIFAESFDWRAPERRTRKRIEP